MHLSALGLVLGNTRAQDGWDGLHCLLCPLTRLVQVGTRRQQDKEDSVSAAEVAVVLQEVFFSPAKRGHWCSIYIALVDVVRPVLASQEGVKIQKKKLIQLPRWQREKDAKNGRLFFRCLVETRAPTTAV